MEINLTAPINNLGYGIVGLNFLKHLDAYGNKTSLWEIGQTNVDTQEDYEIVKKCKNLAKTFSNSAPSLRIYHQNDMAQHVGKGLHCGLPIFELNKFSGIEFHHLDSLDKIFVCSKWAKTILEEVKLGYKTSVVPLGVDRSIFNESVPESVKRHDTKTIFFNCGKWEIRKGHQILVDAFNKAFEEKDDVKLIMNCSNPFLSEKQTNEWISLYKNSKLGNKIDIVPKKLNSQRELANLMHYSDFGIFPALAEGWNLEALEMLSCGKIIIATNYSGHTEFLTEKNSFLIDVDYFEDAYDGVWFFGNGQWAVPNVDQLVSHMRKLHKYKQEKGMVQNEHAIETAKEFTWNNSVRKLLENLK